MLTHDLKPSKQRILAELADFDLRSAQNTQSRQKNTGKEQPSRK